MIGVLSVAGPENLVCPLGNSVLRIAKILLRLAGMKTRILIILLVIAAALPLASLALSCGERVDLQVSLVRKIPPRPARSMTGSEFAKSIYHVDRGQREQAILHQLTAGNLPDFLRQLKPVHFSRQSADGRETELTIFAMPDYLAIGSNDDFMLIPMALNTALKVAMTYGFILPTRKIVDAIFSQSAVHLVPQPLPAGPRMVSTAYFAAHNQKIQKQRLSLLSHLGDLISGHKKDVVVTNRLIHRLGKIAIYGWHYASGSPIQPLSTVHGANYADYSHGIRLISDTVLLDGEPRSIYEILEDPALSPLLSDEGPLGKIRDLMTRYLRPPARAVERPAMWATRIHS
jgi:hypothetical protein